MEEANGRELSARKAEYLAYIYAKGCTVRTGDLSRHFQVHPSTITKTLEEIASAGFLDHVPYRGVTLTPEGYAYARFLQRRHRILSLVLSRFGFSADEACREAKNFEGYISREVVNRICASLGHPVMSVCGRIEHDTACCPCSGEEKSIPEF
jgi:DtxR family Mn-dependent transcriptional regulator